jgi:hypothetical protein
VGPGSAGELVLQILIMWWAVVGLVSVLRALPPFFGWANRGIKPWACDLCMSFWPATALAVTELVLHGRWHVLLAIPAVTGLGIATLSRLTPTPPGGPPDFPPLVDSSRP